jgi:hypothetical protein
MTVPLGSVIDVPLAVIVLAVRMPICAMAFTAVAKSPISAEANVTVPARPATDTTAPDKTPALNVIPAPTEVAVASGPSPLISLLVRVTAPVRPATEDTDA